MRRVLLVTFLAASLPSCGSSEPDEAARPVRPAVAAVPAAAREADPPRPPPLPDFQGLTLDGARVEASSLLGRRMLLFFFNPEVGAAAPVAQAVQAVATESRAHNFTVLGIALAADRGAVSRFAAERGLEFPIVYDASGEIADRFQLRAPIALLGADAEGRVTFSHVGELGDDVDARAAVETLLREALRLPAVHAELDLALGERPRAPEFRGEPIEPGDPVSLAGFRGRPVVLVFFLHTCPHCHEALKALRDELAAIPEAQRPRLVGISVSDRALAVRERLNSDGLDFFPVLLDPDRAIRSAYGAITGVPDIVLIDAEGVIAARMRGWRSERDPALLRMRLARLSGQPVPMLLHATGYSGSEVCGVCHESQHRTWQLTAHATAFDTLIRHGADSNAECVGCHVVGHGKSGGYTTSVLTPELENVGCESCHGRGGPHLSPDAVRGGDYEATCKTCHDPKHSLGFEYARFLPRVSHAANLQFARLSQQEKRRLLEERARPRTDLLPTGVAHVGSEACRSCHAAQYETWSRSAHARAIESLASQGKARQADCLACHTTAFGRPGGFPAGGEPAAHRDLARVGCESCHGPGGDHVAAEAPRRGTIVSLSDKCDSCVILQICGACHDEANDPGFEFSVQQKIDAQRHGGRAPASPDRGGSETRRAIPDGARLGLLERAFGGAG